MESNKKSPSYKEVWDKKAAVRWQIGSVDDALETLLRSDSQRQRETIEEGLNGVWARLRDRRDALLAQLTEEKDPIRFSVRRDAKPPELKSSRSASPLLNTMFDAMRCDPIDEETVQLTSLEIGCDFFQSSRFAYSQFIASSWDSFPADERIFYDFIIADPNNDYYNLDDNGVWVAPWWRFELPERPFSARYSLQAETSTHFTANAFSNNFLNRVTWWAWVSGIMHVEIPPNPEIPLNPDSDTQLAIDENGDLVAIGPKPVHVLAPESNSRRNDYYDSGLATMQRTIDISGGDSPPTVIVAFPTLFWVDGGRLEVQGAADFLFSSGDLAWNASINCTITRL